MDKKQVRERLEAERARLTDVRDASERLLEGAREAEGSELSNLDQHPADEASELFERERDTTVHQRVEGELGEVEAALGRLEAGTYGVCELCSKPIGDERLEAMPATRYCLEDQARAERDPLLRSNA